MSPLFSLEHLAVPVLLQLVQDEGHKFPLVVPSLIKYVDDIYGGSDDLSEAEAIAHQVTLLCQVDGFTFSKWVNNH